MGAIEQVKCIRVTYVGIKHTSQIINMYKHKH